MQNTKSMTRIRCAFAVDARDNVRARASELSWYEDLSTVEEAQVVAAAIHQSPPSGRDGRDAHRLRQGIESKRAEKDASVGMRGRGPSGPGSPVRLAMVRWRMTSSALRTARQSSSRRAVSTVSGAVRSNHTYQIADIRGLRRRIIGGGGMSRWMEAAGYYLLRQGRAAAPSASASIL